MTTTAADLKERLEDDLSRLSDAHDVPGVSVALAHGADVVEASIGVVNTRTQVPVTPDTLFQIQSVTKIFTATLVLQLVDEGLVDLDTSVQTYLPGFRTADAAASSLITVRHLLAHTGGFEGDLWQPTTSGPDALERFVHDLVSQAPQHSRPGERFSYCNAGYGTLGRLIEVQRNTTYEHALRRYLAEPLGIGELAFSADQALAFRTSIGHVRRDASAPLSPTPEWAVLPPSNPAAGNQLAMSARGLLALGRLFLANGMAGGVLSPSSASLMLQPQIRHRGAATASFQGLGWRLHRPGLVEHGGSVPGVASALRFAPGHGLAAAVLTNADAGAKLAQQLLDPLFADLSDIPAESAPAAPPVGPRETDPQPFLGRYSTRQFQLEVTQENDGRLWLSREPRNETVTMARLAGTENTTSRHEMRPLAKDTFVLVAPDERPSGTMTFLDQGSDARFRFLANDRVAPRDA